MPRRPFKACVIAGKKAPPSPAPDRDRSGTGGWRPFTFNPFGAGLADLDPMLHMFYRQVSIRCHWMQEWKCRRKGLLSTRNSVPRDA